MKSAEADRGRVIPFDIRFWYMAAVVIGRGKGREILETVDSLGVFEDCSIGIVGINALVSLCNSSRLLEDLVNGVVLKFCLDGNDDGSLTFFSLNVSMDRPIGIDTCIGP